MSDPSPAADAEAPLWRAISSLPPAGRTPDALLQQFLAHVADTGVTLYPAQEEALLQLASGQHLVLATPTGSGKSLVAQFHHLLSLGQGRRSWYTCPIKALVHEKFFDLCRAFGSAQVGLMTGDASVNRTAPILCATAEVLANVAVTGDAERLVDDVVMDEFHFYGDVGRGVAWQLPLLTLPNATFTLMSATLGDTAALRAKLLEVTGREVALVSSAARPVPLDFAYSEVPLQEALLGLLAANKAPLYVVHFGQRDAIEAAQATTSIEVASKEQKQALKDACAHVRFDTPFGQVMRRLLLHGIGLHHAGLLPKYRLLTEELARAGLLRVIMGTDTLGVGINVPIRTVVLSKLCKFDGHKVGILSVRDFQQIVGRAGRKGFDAQGSVVCQAPEHVIENRRMESRLQGDPKKLRKFVRKKPPQHNYVPWDQNTFETLQRNPPETIASQFALSHHLACLLFRSHDNGYRELVGLIGRCHESARSTARLRRQAKQMFRVLRAAQVVELVPRAHGRRAVRLNERFGVDFSLTHALALFVVFALPQLDATADSYALDVLSLVESILESPQGILKRQTDVAKDEANKRLKAEGKSYEERVAELEQVTHDKPLAEQLYPLFDLWSAQNPWADDVHVRPKSIARRLIEDGQSFSAFVRAWGLERLEGVLLRYLMQAHRALVACVPSHDELPGVAEVAAYLRALVARTDASLLEAWASLEGASPTAPLPEAPAGPKAPDTIGAAFASAPRALLARLRAELHGVVLALARGDAAEAARPFRGEEAEVALSAALEALGASHGPLLQTPIVKQAQLTQLEPPEDGVLVVRQTLLFVDAEATATLVAELDAEQVLRDGEPLFGWRALERG
jgi:hypothetical protein